MCSYLSCCNTRLLNQEPRSSFLQEGGAGFHNGFLVGRRGVEERIRMMRSVFNQENPQPVKRSLVSWNGQYVLTLCLCSLFCVCTYTHAHTRTYGQVHTHTHAHTHTHTHTHTCTNTHRLIMVISFIRG